MKTVWKFVFDDLIMMPKDAKILTIQRQDDKPVIWAIVETTNELEPRRFRVYGTGHTIAENINLVYVGTIQDESSSIVWHIFEAINTKSTHGAEFYSNLR